VAISDDGTRAFIGTDRGDLLQWDTSGWKVTPFSHDNGVISAIAISPDGKTLAAIGVAGILQVCSIVPSLPQCAAVSALGGWGYSVGFSKDGHWVGATSGVEGVSRLALVWDLNTKKSTLLKGHTERISSIQFDKSGNRAVTVSWDGTARIWDLSSGNEIVRLVEPKGRMSTAGFSPDGE
jgi:WD40 repeat protein